MRRSRNRAALAGLFLLSACGQGEVPGSLAAAAPAAVICRLGPDDGPPTVDRGIGGTGGAGDVADRGIGGTGAPVRVADRGIGGTGIIAVITGFASICLGGVEVAMAQDVPVTLNGSETAATALRAGQVAVVDAVDAGGGLSARSVALRHEVSGPVERVGTGGLLLVAGQPVRQQPGGFGLRNPRVGDWVAVSGLRAPDGVIQATRIDARTPGEVMVRGPVVVTPAGPSIGALQIGGDAAALQGGPVTVTGQYRGARLLDPRIQPDRLARDPASIFAAGTRRILVESYATAAPGGVQLGGGATLPAAAGLATTTPQRAVVEIERGSRGTLRAIGLRPDPTARPVGPAGGVPLASSSRAPQPAPVPRPTPQRDARGGGPVRTGQRNGAGPGPGTPPGQRGFDGAGPPAGGPPGGGRPPPR